MSPLTQSTFLYQHGGNRTTTFIQEGFDHDAVGHAVNHRFQLQDFGLDQDGFQQVVDAFARLGGDVHELASPPQSSDMTL